MAKKNEVEKENEVEVGHDTVKPVRESAGTEEKVSMVIDAGNNTEEGEE